MLVNVYRDSSNFYAVPIVKNPKKDEDKPKNVRIRTDFDNVFDELFDNYINKGFDNSPENRNELYKRLSFDMQQLFDGEYSDIKDKVRCRLVNKAKSAFRRYTRFQRKIQMHIEFWTHFTTLTYNSSWMTEETFEKKARKFFSNCATRHGWVIAGKFERAPETGRLHFHGLIHIPYGEEVGDIVEIKEYNVLTSKMETRYSNERLDATLGRSDFSSIKKFELLNKNASNYIMKYCNKNDGKSYYSKGIPSGLIMDIDEEKDVSSEVEREITFMKKDGTKVTYTFKNKQVLFKEIFMPDNNDIFHIKEYAHSHNLRLAT